MPITAGVTLAPLSRRIPHHCLPAPPSTPPGQASATPQRGAVPPSLGTPRTLRYVGTNKAPAALLCYRNAPAHSLAAISLVYLVSSPLHLRHRHCRRRPLLSRHRRRRWLRTRSPFPSFPGVSSGRSFLIPGRITIRLQDPASRLSGTACLAGRIAAGDVPPRHPIVRLPTTNGTFTLTAEDRPCSVLDELITSAPSAFICLCLPPSPRANLLQPTLSPFRPHRLSSLRRPPSFNLSRYSSLHLCAHSPEPFGQLSGTADGQLKIPMSL